MFSRAKVVNIIIKMVASSAIDKLAYLNLIGAHNAVSGDTCSVGINKTFSPFALGGASLRLLTHTHTHTHTF